MNCWHCNTELIWGGDHDLEVDESFVMETNLSCPNCHSFVLVMRAHETSSTCSTCQGTGRVTVEKMRTGEQNYDRFPETIYYEAEIECDKCGGDGMSKEN